MNKVLAVAFFLACLGCATAQYAGCTNQTVKGVYWYDGDTITRALLTNGEVVKIRSLCVDAPEHDQPEGPAASARFKELTGTTFTACIWKKDVYNRSLAVIYNANKVDVNCQMCREGHNVFFKYQAGCDKYKPCCQYGKDNKKGAWASPTFIEPEFWKHPSK